MLRGFCSTRDKPEGRVLSAMRPCATTLESEITEEEMDALLAVLGEATTKGPFLEIGTAAGGTLWRMVRSVRATDPTSSFSVLDPLKYFPNQRATVEKNLRDHGIDPASIDFRVCTSDEGYRIASGRGERFGFIFVDGNHKCRYVMEDLRWASLLHAGGRLVLHDYGPRHPGVIAAVDRFLRNNSNYRKVRLAGTLLVLAKDRESTRDEVGFPDMLVAHVLTVAYSLRASAEKRLRR